MPTLPFHADSLKELPDAPGVYIFIGPKKEVLYVGKATSLRDRVRSYFSKSGDMRLVTAVIHRYAEAIDFVLTEDTKKALLLENSLIKQHGPRFNIRLRDDKTYFSLRLDLDAKWPWFQIVRKRKKEDGVLFFGPYTSAQACRRTLQFLGSLFPMRTCTDAVLENRVRPCLAYEIKRCNAPCVGLVTREDYMVVVRQAIDFLKGKNSEVVADLKKRMKEAAARTEYEIAADLRDRIQAIERTVESPQVTKDIGRVFDVVGLARRGNQVGLSILSIRDGIIASTASYRCAGLETDDATLRALLTQFYADGRPVPPEIALPDACEDMEILAEVLTERRGAIVDLLVPERGEKKRLLELAQKNAAAALSKEEEEDAETKALLEALQRSLGLVHLPKKIECFDISNFQGAEVVGSCAAFTDGRPDKARYRRYRIRDFEGQNDFAAMAEVIRRRVIRGKEEGELPDLVVIDGGKAQLDAALDVLRELRIEAFDVVSLAKARSGGRVVQPLQEFERVFKPHMPVPIVLDQNAPELKLLVRVRDEAHRFAITYHRKLRAKAQTTSILELVPGIGKSRATALLKAFGSLDGVKSATESELGQIKGMSQGRIAEIRKFFESGGKLPTDDDLVD